MKNLDERIDELYEEFVDFPVKNKIVRNGHRNDAFCLLVFEVLLHNYHQIKRLSRQEPTHQSILANCVVPPPDDSIDIFFEENDLDECRYHIVQVKNAELSPAKIENCFLLMESSVSLFLKKQKEVRKNLREIMADTDFSKQYRNDCIFYVVHRGQTHFIRNQKPYQKIITGDELLILEKGTRQMSVPNEHFVIDTASNFIINNFVDSDQGAQKVNPTLPQSLLCNFSGYDLAQLNNKYSNTLLGRNILYGQNLRESLNKSSKTFESMFETIDKEPELFLFYNNGITILSSNVNAKKINNKETITVEEFSIINGAQTTSTLGAYLRNAEINNEEEKIENLKKVFVLTKIYEINNQLQNHENISENIKIFNNTQTPLSSRDMVSIRKEQIALQDTLFNGVAPNIFIYIKKGEVAPPYPKTSPFQRVTNEVLAQLALCSFALEPFTAKDKKAKIFDNDAKEDVLLNPVYHKLFNQTDGILFSKSKAEINELLFVFRLHEDTKKHQKNHLKEQLNRLNQTSPTNDLQKTHKEDQINRIKRNIEIANVCLFFNITCYYEIKRHYDYLIPNINDINFDTKKYFDSQQTYKDSLIKSFSELVYGRTIETIRANSGVENVNNWVRSEKNQTVFLDSLRNYLTSEGHIVSEKYLDFVKQNKM